MTKQTIALLNQINRDFYKLTASEFDQTRQQPWQGWYEILPSLRQLARQSAAHNPSAPLRVLDLGCGNGRFAGFLEQELAADLAELGIKLEYTGIDINQQLLAKARQAHPSGTFFRHDLVEDLGQAESAILSHVPTSQDCVVAFGVLHHIPSSELRLEFLQRCRQATRAGGRSVMTAWHPSHSPSLMARRSLPQTIGIDPAEFETGDYLLDWRRGVTATRYCHDASSGELAELVSKTAWQIESQFNADGRSSNMNTYLILK